MLNLTQTDVKKSPFPHAVKQGILPEELFRELRADFPEVETFHDQDELTKGIGSRTGSGTGFDIYRGDDAYNSLVANSPAWHQFDAYINSPDFVGKFIELFGDDLDKLGCKVSVDPQAYDPTMVEKREVLTEHKTIGERVRAVKGKLFDGKGEKSKKQVPLFSRLDIEKSVGGYAKPPHCDRPNRLCSLIIYFSDLADDKPTGGELNIYAHKDRNKTPVQHERHPQPDAVEIVATLKPKQNLGVFFPCSNNSYHGVNALESQDIERDFLYINISTKNYSAW